ncbi:MAG: hypothetical protein R3D84_04215 [Paracoccaceae bacterium]
MTPKPSPGCKSTLSNTAARSSASPTTAGFLDDITGRILELDRGRGVPYEGNYLSWLEQKAKRLAQEAREDKARQKVLGTRTGMHPRRCQGPAVQAEGADRPL